MGTFYTIGAVGSVPGVYVKNTFGKVARTAPGQLDRGDARQDLWGKANPVVLTTLLHASQDSSHLECNSAIKLGWN